MTRKGPKSASPEWFAGGENAGSDPNAAFSFRVPEQNGSVHADPWSSGECRSTRPATAPGLFGFGSLLGRAADILADR